MLVGFKCMMCGKEVEFFFFTISESFLSVGVEMNDRSALIVLDDNQ